MANVDIRVRWPHDYREALCQGYKVSGYPCVITLESETEMLMQNAPVLSSLTNYHGTHPLTLLEGNRCRGCNRVLDPNDDGRYNGRFRGGHDGWRSHNENLNDPQFENKCP